MHARSGTRRWDMHIAFENRTRGEYTKTMSEKNSTPSDSPKNRYYPRINVEILLAYRPPGAGEDETTVVKSRTIGLGGLMFEADHPLPVGSTFDLDLVLGDEHLQVGARVVYSNRMKNDFYQNGFSFVDLNEAQRERLMNFFLLEYDRNPPDGP